LVRLVREAIQPTVSLEVIPVLRRGYLAHLKNGVNTKKNLNAELSGLQQQTVESSNIDKRGPEMMDDKYVANWTDEGLKECSGEPYHSCGKQG